MLETLDTLKSNDSFWPEIVDRRLEDEPYLLELERQLWSREQTDLSQLTIDQQYQLLTYRCYSEFPPETESAPSQLYSTLVRSRQSGIPLNVKYGIDPTGPDIHWGHVLALRMAMKMVRMGHNLHFIVGGFTAMVGDGSDKDTPRKPLTEEQVETNQAKYFHQIAPFIPQNPLGSIDYQNNMHWYSNGALPHTQLIRIFQAISARDLLKRRTFQGRLNEGGDISLAELAYPIYTGYDSVMVKADVEVCGQDQLSNTRVARAVQNVLGLPQEAILATHLIHGTDGRGNKMSKSLGNYIGINEDPEVMFTKVMEMADDLMPYSYDNEVTVNQPIRFGLIKMYLEQYTEIDDTEIGEVMSRLGRQENPMDPLSVKKLLGRFLVGIVYGREIAMQAQNVFEENYALMQDRRRKLHEKISESGGVQDILPSVDVGTIWPGGVNGGASRLMKRGGVTIIHPKGGTIAIIHGNDNYLVRDHKAAEGSPKQIPLNYAQFREWLTENGIDLQGAFLRVGDKYYSILIEEID